MQHDVFTTGDKFFAQEKVKNYHTQRNATQRNATQRNATVQYGHYCF